jgi:hypothetical protein
MSWGCFAFGPQGGTIRDKKIRDEFRSAKNCPWINVGGGYVHLGGRDTAQMIIRAGVDAYDAGWKMSVRDLHFNWDITYNKEDAEHYHSAKTFMNICHKHNLTIQFSY